MKLRKAAFALTRTIQRRRVLTIRARFHGLNFGQRMQLIAAERRISTAFNLS